LGKDVVLKRFKFDFYALGEVLGYWKGDGLTNGARVNDDIGLVNSFLYLLPNILAETEFGVVLALLRQPLYKFYLNFIQNLPLEILRYHVVRRFS
jgi:hypothetical protein